MTVLQNPNTAYHADKTRISNSGLSDVAKSPALYWYNHLNPDRSKPNVHSVANTKKGGTPIHFREGNAAHCKILEPHLFDQYYTVCPVYNFAKNEDKKLAAEFDANVGIKEVILNEDEYDDMMRYVEVAKNNSTVQYLLGDGLFESPLYFDFEVELDGETIYIPGKAKLDIDQRANEYAADTKFVTDASPDKFIRKMIDLRYYVQGATYFEAAWRALGVRLKAFIFIAVEKTPPYHIGFYSLEYGSPEWELGHEIMMRDLRTYARCWLKGKDGVHAKENWPGYSNDIIPVSFPAWALRKDAPEPENNPLENPITENDEY